MQLLNKKAFKILLIAIITGLAISSLSSILSIISNISILRSDSDGFVFDVSFRGRAIFGIVSSSILLIGWLIYFPIMLMCIVRHKNTPRKGSYLLVMLVVAIILLVYYFVVWTLNIVNLFRFHHFSFSLLFLILPNTIIIVTNILIIIGVCTHRKRDNQ